jgi:hypothetical protein
MTEREWLTCSRPEKMLEFLRCRASGRKLRLFACARARVVWQQLSPLGRRAVEVAEGFADGLASGKERYTACEAVRAASIPSLRGHDWLAIAAAAEDELQGMYAGPRSVRSTLEPMRECALYREVFGPLPFRPVPILPCWLAWEGGTVPGLARAVYEEGGFDGLPVLADALEEAGCADEALLTHLREPGLHARGCWAVDLLLSRE